MFWDTKISHLHCAGGALAFDVLLGNSLAGKNELGSQTHSPVRPRELRISQLTCNSDRKPSHLRPVCSAATRGRASLDNTRHRFYGSLFSRNASRNLKIYFIIFKKCSRGKSYSVFPVSLEESQWNEKYSQISTRKCLGVLPTWAAGCLVSVGRPLALSTMSSLCFNSQHL